MAGDAAELERLRCLVAEQAAELRQYAAARDGLDAAVVHAIGAAGFGQWTHDFVTGRRFWDARNRLIFGIPPGAPTPEHEAFFTLVHPEDRAWLRERLARAAAEPTPAPFVHSYRIQRPPTGETRWLASFGRATFEGARCVRIAGVTHDVTEQHRLEAALRRMNETLEAQVAARTRERDGMWQLSQDLMVVLDRDGRVTAANPAWRYVLGRSPAQLHRGGPFDLLHPQDRARGEAIFGSLAAGAPLPPTEIRMRHAQGGYKVISWAAVAREGTIYAVGRDVTAHHEAAEALARAQDDLRQSQKMEAVGQLTGGIAHDFNNLLTGIIGGLELIKTRIGQGRTGELGRLLDAAVSSAARAGALTHRLLAFSRRQTLDERALDVGVLVESMVDLIRRTVGPGITVAWSAEPGLWATRCDANQLENALLNLAINARDAMARGGRLTITCANAPGGEAEFVAITVADTGQGMSPETRERAFEPFFTTKPIGQGTGLGLSMVYGFVHQSGGEVVIDSVPGEGTAVRILLPRTAGPLAAPAPNLPAPRAAAATPSVLVVDDEPAVRLMVAETLREHHYPVTEAPDGSSAMALLRAGAPADILVTDVGLPGGMNGRELADAARFLRPALKVLLITGYSEQAGDALRRDGMEVLVKPFAPTALADRVATLPAAPR